MVQTSDGYLLGLHRLGWKKGEDRYKGQQRNARPEEESGIFTSWAAYEQRGLGLSDR